MILNVGVELINIMVMLILVMLIIEMLIWVVLTIDIAMVVFLIFPCLGFGQRGENALERGGGDRKDGAKKSDNKT